MEPTTTTTPEPASTASTEDGRGQEHVGWTPWRRVWDRGKLAAWDGEREEVVVLDRAAYRLSDADPQWWKDVFNIMVASSGCTNELLDRIQKVIVIRNDKMKCFEDRVELLSQQMKAGNKPSYDYIDSSGTEEKKIGEDEGEFKKQDDDIEKRKNIYYLYEKILNKSFHISGIDNTGIVFTYYGTNNLQEAKKIIECKQIPEAKEDRAFYGRGCYSTSNIGLALEYASPILENNKVKYVCVMLACMGNPFPVIERPVKVELSSETLPKNQFEGNKIEFEKSWYDKPLKPGYTSHIACVREYVEGDLDSVLPVNMGYEKFFQSIKTQSESDFNLMYINSYNDIVPFCILEIKENENINDGIESRYHPNFSGSIRGPLFSSRSNERKYDESVRSNLVRSGSINQSSNPPMTLNYSNSSSNSSHQFHTPPSTIVRNVSHLRAKSDRLPNEQNNKNSHQKSDSSYNSGKTIRFTNSATNSERTSVRILNSNSNNNNNNNNNNNINSNSNSLSSYSDVSSGTPADSLRNSNRLSSRSNMIDSKYIYRSERTSDTREINIDRFSSLDIKSKQSTRKYNASARSINSLPRKSNSIKNSNNNEILIRSEFSKIKRHPTGLKRTEISQQANKVSNYSAFPKVAEMNEVRLAQSTELFTLDNGIEIYQPVRVFSGIRTEGTNITGSISHNGVFAVCSNLDGWVLQLTDLTNVEKKAEIVVENSTLAGFYNDMIILLTLNQKLRETNVNNAFEKHNLSAFNQLNGARVNKFGDISNINKTKTLYYINKDKYIYMYDLRSRERGVISEDKTVKFILSLTGIICNVKLIFQPEASERLYSLNMDDEVLELGYDFDFDNPLAILPCFDNITDFSSSAIQNGTGLVYKHRNSRTEDIFEFSTTCPPIRLYKDIFFIYNDSEKRWVICRIVVPSSQSRKEGTNPIELYSAFDGVEELFQVKEALKSELIDVADNIHISVPIVCYEDLRREGDKFRASISPYGVLAIYSFIGKELKTYKYEKGDKCNILQLTELINDKRVVELETEQSTSVAFYNDNMIVLTWGQLLREANVDIIFKNKDVSSLIPISDFEVTSDAELTLVHKTKRLYFRRLNNKLSCYNVDTHKYESINNKIDVGEIASFTGIELGVRVIFNNWKYKKAHFVRTNKKLEPFHIGMNTYFLKNIFPSTSDPMNLEKAVLRDGSKLLQKDYCICIDNPIIFDSYNSTIRLYKDVFLVYDQNKSKWVFVRIIID